MINAAFVRECKPRVKMYEVTCDALPGFILRVLPTGKKVALVRYRVAGKDGSVPRSVEIDEVAGIVYASVIRSSMHFDRCTSRSIIEAFASHGGPTAAPE